MTHRDVKPQNILITGNDFAYLVDFGIASAKTDEKLTQLGTAVGTWKYMAPERFSNDEATPRADVYALACVLYECLTGAPPYRAESAGVLVTAHMMEPIPRPSAQGFGVDQAFDDVIAGGMAKKPNRALSQRRRPRRSRTRRAFQTRARPCPDHPAPQRHLGEAIRHSAGQSPAATKARRRRIGSTGNAADTQPLTDSGRGRRCSRRRRSSGWYLADDEARRPTTFKDRRGENRAGIHPMLPAMAKPDC